MSNNIISDFQKARVFSGLDGLRFLSITAVVWHHAVTDSAWFAPGHYGFLGVDLFFVISGFLIVSLLLREKDKTNTISLKKFYIRRSLRIFPIYYGFILLLAAGYYFGSPNSDFGRGFLSELPLYIFYLANFAPVTFSIVWSLATEEQFYLVCPFLEKYLGKMIYLVLIIFIFINQIINFFPNEVARLLGNPNLAKLNIFQATFTPILLGVALAHYLHFRKQDNTLLTILGCRYCSLFLIGAILASCFLLPEDISGLPRLLLQLSFTALIASTVLSPNGYLNNALNIKPIAHIGAISYGIYLFHIHAIVVAEKVLEKLGVFNEIATFLSSYTLVIGLAYLSYRFFESYFLRYKERFSTLHKKHS